MHHLPKKTFEGKTLMRRAPPEPGRPQHTFQAGRSAEAVNLVRDGLATKTPRPLQAYTRTSGKRIAAAWTQLKRLSAQSPQRGAFIQVPGAVNPLHPWPRRLGLQARKDARCTNGRVNDVSFGLESQVVAASGKCVGIAPRSPLEAKTA